jgi:hypothetical protein
MNKMRLKALLSILLILLLFVIFSSGILLYFGKTGLILGFRRAFLLRLHGRCSLAFVLLAACHLALNYRLFKEELKKLFKPDQS